VASDLFTVGRTLAVLCTDFPTYQSTHRFDLPTPSEVALYARCESLYAFLVRATAAEPADRFASAEEMAAQLAGVLREIVATNTGLPAPGPSACFTPPGRAAVRPDWAALPTPMVNPEDPQAALIVSLSAATADEIVRQLEPQRGLGVEVDLWLARALIEQQQYFHAIAVVEAIAAAHPREWRAWWYRGIVAAATLRHDRATSALIAVHRHLPGELAPKLALGMVAEAAGDPTAAARWYDVVARTDRAYTSAAFGLGRCLAALGRTRPAAAAYAGVPETSSDHLDAKIAEARLLLGGAPESDRPMADVIEASTIVGHGGLGPELRARLAVDVLDTAVRVVDLGPAPPAATVLGRHCTERDLRLGLEAALRDLARHATSRAERVAIVERANRQRPKSLR
jgi:serine/threonine-protein kinase PknG